MWRDPLDELIEDLEQVVTPSAPRTQLPPLEELLKYTDIIRRYGRSGRVKERLEKEPGFHRFMAQMRGLANRPADVTDAAPAEHTRPSTDQSPGPLRPTDPNRTNGHAAVIGRVTT